MGAVLRVRASWDQEAGWLQSLEAEVRGALKRPQRLSVRLLESSFLKP